MSKKSKLIKAASSLVSTAMEAHLRDRPDDTPVRIEVSGRCGFGKTITLGELRAFWIAFAELAA